MAADSKWLGRNSGPVVRPYAVTRGRTEPAGGELLDLIAVIIDSGVAPGDDDRIDLSPEHRRILSLCQQPSTVADVASDTALPLGVVQVLISDLIVAGRIRAIDQRTAGGQPSAALLREVLHGLRAL